MSMEADKRTWFLQYCWWGNYRWKESVFVACTVVSVLMDRSLLPEESVSDSFCPEWKVLARVLTAWFERVQVLKRRQILRRPSRQSGSSVSDADGGAEYGLDERTVSASSLPLGWTTSSAAGRTSSGALFKIRELMFRVIRVPRKRKVYDIRESCSMMGQMGLVNTWY